MDQRQQHAPYLEGLRHHLSQGVLSFHVPGHQGGRGAEPELHRLLGAPTLWADVTEVLGLDDLHRPTGQLREAQELAALAFGANQTHFLVNGSTSGNHAMLLACTGPGDLVLVPRNAHRSVWGGLMLSGASAAAYQPPFDSQLGVFGVPTPDCVSQAHAIHPQARTIVISSPSYYGHAADTAALVRRAQELDLMVLADEAWGAHLPFHQGFPTSAVQAGADLVVHSTHKMLPSLTQAAMLHVQGSRIDRARVDLVLRTITTSSPSALLLASIDSARRRYALHGEQILQNLAELADLATEQLRALEGIFCRGGELKRPGEVSLWDPTHLVISALGRGYTGYELETYLRYEHRLQIEMPDYSGVVVVLTAGHTEEHVHTLTHAVASLPSRPPLAHPRMLPPEFPTCPVTPSLALREPSTSVSVQNAIGRRSAEAVTLYPPGIPWLLPGEEICEQVVRQLQDRHKAGGRVQGASDLSLQTLRVLV